LLSASVAARYSITPQVLGASSCHANCAPRHTRYNRQTHGHVGDCTQLVDHTRKAWVDALCLTTVQEGKQRTNDINANGDGPTWIQTATGGDKPQTAGGTPTRDSQLLTEATERSEGGSNRHNAVPSCTCRNAQLTTHTDVIAPSSCKATHSAIGATKHQPQKQTTYSSTTTVAQTI
jgi:hypothetical protein